MTRLDFGVVSCDRSETWGVWVGVRRWVFEIGYRLKQAPNREIGIAVATVLLGSTVQSVLVVLYNNFPARVLIAKKLTIAIVLYD